MSKDEKYYSVRQAAEMLGRSEPTIRKWLADGNFPNVITTESAIAIPAGDIVATIREEEDALRARLNRLANATQRIRDDRRAVRS